MMADGAAVDPFAPLNTRMLPVGDGHSLYVETIGNPSGMPAVFLHGGPGGGSQISHRSLFDPRRFHAVLFDQRGAGRSLPFGERRANTTAHQIRDLETIREVLGFSRWLVVGGSWGATLGLAYTEAHPERVSGLVLRATFLGTRAELDKAFGTTMDAVYPALYRDFLGMLPENERNAPLDYYWRRILDPDPAVHRPAAIAWHDTERILSVAFPATRRLDPASIHSGDTPLPSTPFMEAHYFSQDCFLEPGQLVRNVERLKGIRGVIVQGEMDHLCPPPQALTLASLWPSARVVMLEKSGHGLSEPAISAAVREAIASFA